MMHLCRTRLPYVAALLFATTLLCLTSCGGSPPPPTTPAVAEAAPKEPPADPWAYFPTDVISLMRVDTRLLGQSPYAPSLTPLIQRLGAETATTPVGSLRLSSEDLTLLRRSELLMAAQLAGAEGVESLLLIKGGPSGPALKQWLDSLAARQTPPMTVSPAEEAGLACFQLGDWRIAEVPGLEPGFVIAATGDSFATMAGRAGGASGSTPLESADFKRRCGSVQCETAMGSLVRVMTDSLRSQLQSELGGTVSAETLRHVTHASVRLTATDGIDGLVLAEMTEPARADGAANQLTRRRDSMRGGMQGMMVRALGVMPLIDGLTISADGATVRVGLRLSDGDTRSLLSRVDSLLEMSRQVQGGKGS